MKSAYPLHWPRSLSVGLVAVALALLGLALLGQALVLSGWVGRHWDPIVEMQVAERISRLGGPYYVTGSDQKGPIWLGLYRLAIALGGSNDKWLAYGLIAVAIWAGIGWSCATIAILAPGIDLRRAPAGFWVTVVAGGIFATAILAYSPTQWATALYSRNVVALMEILAICAILGAVKLKRSSAFATSLLIVAGLFVGGAVQTNPASAAPAVAVTGLVAWLACSRKLGPPVRSVAVFVLAALAGLASVFIWYLLRGALDPFLDQWWLYNRYYTGALGISFTDNVAEAYRQFPQWLTRTPWALASLVAGAATILWRIRRAQSVWLEVWCFIWLASEAVAIAAAQRYYEPYFVLVAVPSVVIGVLALTRLGASLHAAAAVGACVVLGIALVQFNGLSMPIRLALGELRDYNGTAALRASQMPRPGTAERRLRQQFLRYSRGNPYAVIWSNQPYTYDITGAVSATRFPEARWLTGTIYGGGLGPGSVQSRKYILPNTERYWLADIARTPPNVWVDFGDSEPEPGSAYRSVRDCMFRLRWREPYLEPFRTAEVRVYSRVRTLAACLFPKANESDERR